MAVAADAAAPAVRPSLEEARELARDHNLIPLRHTFIADTETPVSAFLKLRGHGSGDPGVPARIGRAGPAHGPLLVHRRAAAQGAALVARRRAATRTRSPTRRSSATRRRRCRDGPPFAGGAVGLFGYDLVRTVEPLGDAEPGRRRPARPGADAQRHPRRLRPPPAHAHDHRERVPGGRHRAQLRATRWRRSTRRAGCSPARCPTSATARSPAIPPASSRTCRASSSRAWSRASSSTPTPATSSRWSRPSAGRRSSASTRSACTAGCAR